MKTQILVIKKKDGEVIKMTVAELAKILGITEELATLHIEMLPSSQEPKEDK